MKENEERLDSVILYDRDFSYDFFAFKVRAPCLSWRHRGSVGAAQTLERSYLLKLDGKIVERPQHMIMRGAPIAFSAALAWQLAVRLESSAQSLAGFMARTLTVRLVATLSASWRPTH